MTKKEITQCAHCGNRVTQEELYSVETVDEIETEEGDLYDFRIFYRLVKCTTCNGIALYTMSENDLGDNASSFFDIASLVYPDEKKFDKTVPDSVRTSYTEAKKVKNVSSYAFAALIRKSLEQICLDKGAKGYSLKEKIVDLAERNIIPRNLADMADTLRSLGNIGVHEIAYEFGWEEVRAMDDFLVAVIEYVYIAPEKVRKLAESIENKKSRMSSASN